MSRSSARQLICGQRIQRAAYLGRILEDSSEPGEISGNAKTFSADFGQDLEYRLIGDIVADEYRHAPAERCMGHQLADTLSFADSRPLDLEHRLAEQQFSRLGRKCRACGRDVTAQLLGILRRLPIVQRKGIVL